MLTCFPNCHFQPKRHFKNIIWTWNVSENWINLWHKMIRRHSCRSHSNPSIDTLATGHWPLQWSSCGMEWSSPKRHHVSRSFYVIQTKSNRNAFEKACVRLALCRRHKIDSCQFQTIFESCSSIRIDAHSIDPLHAVRQWNMKSSQCQRVSVPCFLLFLQTIINQREIFLCYFVILY